MNISEIIKENILSIEAQLNVDMNNKSLKPIVFIDNTNFNKTETPLAIVHLDIFDAKDVVALDSKMNVEDPFNIINLIGEESVYCVWGKENVAEIKAKLVDWGYVITDKTTIFDLREAASDFYNKTINSFEDIQSIISFASSDVEAIYTSKETIMYSLFIDMLNNDYTNDVLDDSIRNLIVQAEMTNADNIYKGAEFRKTNSNIEFEKRELALLEEFSNNMYEYNVQMSDYLNNRLAQNDLNDVCRMLLSEKATMCRYKKDIYKYTTELLKTYKNDNFESYKFYFKTLQMYAMMEDAFIFADAIEDKNSTLRNFALELGSFFVGSTATYAYTYLLRKNVVAKLNK